MLFNSYEYLIWFLPAAALGYFGLGDRARWAVRWLVVASLFFYGWWNPGHLPLIAASILGNFWIARRIQHAPDGRRWLIAGVAGNLVLLGQWDTHPDPEDGAGPRQQDELRREEVPQGMHGGMVVFRA